MNAKKCDRCGKYYDTIRTDSPWKHVFIMSHEHKQDLCDDCREQLESFYERWFVKKEEWYVFDK